MMKRKRMLALVTACCVLFGQSAWGEIAEASVKIGVEQEDEVVQQSQRNVEADVCAVEEGISAARSVREITRDAQTVCLGGDHSGAISEDGSLYMWGRNTCGQIGNGTKSDQLTPVKVLSDVLSVSVSGVCTRAITKDGDLYIWGGSVYGQTGFGTVMAQTTPVKVLSDVVSVRVGGDHSGAITEDGSLYMWGENTHGQIGNGTTTNQLTPVKILSDVVSVSLGGACSGAITKDGSLYMWGRNPCGQVGNGTTTDQLTPVKVLSDVLFVSVGGGYSGAITEDGSLYMWGKNSCGQVGNGNETNQTTPVKVLSDVVSVSLSYYHSGAITEDGSLYMWGLNQFGQIGNATTTDQLTPVKVLSDVVSVRVEIDRSGAITEDGSLYMWGNSYNGQIGNGTTADQLTPVKVFSDVVFVSLGGSHSGAITEDGNLYMWGRNSKGQVGNATTTDQHMPVKVFDHVRLPGSSTEGKTDQEIGNVLYFREWNPDTQTAYFGDSDFLGSTVTSETDTSFIENIDSLLNHYVLVKRKSRTDTKVDSDYLISICPVESHWGTVTAIDEKSVVIDSVTYGFADNMEITLPNVFLNNKVIFHLIDGKVVGLEALNTVTGTLVKWDERGGQLTISSNGRKTYTFSYFADSEDIHIGDELKVTIDDAGMFYEVRVMPSGPSSLYINIPSDTWNFGNPKGCAKKYWELWFPSLQANKLSEHVQSANGGICYGMVMTAMT